MTDLPEHRVSVTVFATVAAVDALDAGHIVERAIRNALRAARTGHDGLVLPFQVRGESRPVRVHTVRETGMAAGNGYLWTAPTAKAYSDLNSLDMTTTTTKD